MTQEVIASGRRLLVAARSHNQDLDQTDALKSKIHTIRRRMDRQGELEALDLIHRLRKAHSHAFSQLYALGKWTEVRRVSPDVQMLSKGTRFWALIIGNNDYPKAPLSGCVNDAILMQRYLIRYLNVPHDHIRILFFFLKCKSRDYG